jgi:lipoprotein-anchoring transpeptidase ErfK/SrfK
VVALATIKTSGIGTIEGEVWIMWIKAENWLSATHLGNTVYRIHGTNQPSTIGTLVSSGCYSTRN